MKKRPPKAPSKAMSKKTSKTSGALPPQTIGDLHPDDALLWHRVTQSVQPIEQKAQNRAGFETLETFDTKFDAGSVEKKKAAKKPNNPPRETSRTGAAAPSRAATSEPPALNQIEKRLDHRIARGKSGFDARIDLHGMTQFEAHGALLHFLRGAQARGSRVVLVITGKGRIGDDRDHFSMHEAPGVLRRNIRSWLEQPEFRAIVAAYAQAHRRHGGDGAIYVQLRRNRSLDNSS